MKNVFKIVFTVIFVSCLSTYAQSQQLGVRFGLNVANQTIEDNDGKDFYADNTSNAVQRAQLAFHIGPSFEARITESIYFQTGAIFNTKGHRYTYDLDLNPVLAQDSTRAAVNRIILMYLDVPLQIAYKHTLNEKSKVFGSFGPTVAYSFGGQFLFEKINGNTDNDFFPVVNDLEDLPDDNYQGVKPFEISLALMVGYQIKNIQMGVGYVHGLTDTNPPNKGVDQDYSSLNRTLQVSFNVLIGDKNKEDQNAESE